MFIHSINLEKTVCQQKRFDTIDYKISGGTGNYDVTTYWDVCFGPPATTSSVNFDKKYSSDSQGRMTLKITDQMMYVDYLIFVMDDKNNAAAKNKGNSWRVVDKSSSSGQEGSGSQDDKSGASDQEDQTSKPVTSVVVKGVVYKLSEKSKTATATGPESKTATSLTIQSSVKANGKTYKVTAIKDKAFKGMSSLKKVTIGKNVKSIGKYAFQNCKKLKTIEIKTSKLTASNVKSKAFKGIYSKATIKCPKSVKESYKEWLPQKGVPKKAKIK